MYMYVVMMLFVVLSCRSSSDQGRKTREAQRKATHNEGIINQTFLYLQYTNVHVQYIHAIIIHDCMFSVCCNFVFIIIMHTLIHSL